MKIRAGALVALLFAASATVVAAAGVAAVTLADPPPPPRQPAAGSDLRAVPHPLPRLATERVDAEPAAITGIASNYAGTAGWKGEPVWL